MVHDAACPLGLDEYALIIDAISGPYRLLSSESSALKAMCLAHTSFVPLCQKVLFSTVDFTSSQKTDKILDVLRVSPHIAAYIRHLTFRLESESRSTVEQDNNIHTAQFLDKVRNLSSLSLINMSFSLSDYEWESIDPRLSIALLRLMLSPHLQSLDLFSFPLPLQAFLSLGNSPGLKSLAISTVAINEGTEYSAGQVCEALGPSRRSLTAQPQLSNLIISRHSSRAIEVLVGGPSSPYKNPPALDFARLRDVEVDRADERDTEAGNLLIGSAPCLETLTCTLSSRSSATFSGIAAALLKGSFRTLQKLTLHALMPWENEENPLYGSVPELKQLAGEVHSLRTLRLIFSIYTFDTSDDFGHFCQGIKNECTVLDGIFANPNAYPGLRSVSMDFRIHNSVVDICKKPNRFAQEIKQQAFENLNGIPTIDFAFTLENS